MAKKNFIRLNVNDNYLSLGNLFRIIKEESNDGNVFLQSELFSIIFNTYDIADSTVNNYCTGLRSINKKYKDYFLEIKNNFGNDKNILVVTLGKLLNLIEIDEIDIDNVTIEDINNSLNLKRICERLYNISKNDTGVSVSFSTKLHDDLEKQNLYNFMIQVLFYVVLERKQPIYAEMQLENIIEKSIYSTNISVKDVEEFINIQLNSGIWSLRRISELAKKNNPYACFELASMEFYGIITGKPRYEESYKYYKIAADYNHPVANWAIGYLYYNGYIGNRTQDDLLLAYKYFSVAKEMRCSNAFNSLGLIILKGDIPGVNQDKKQAVLLFQEAMSLGNVYAYNNLGKIYEKEGNLQKAFECYKVAAESGESWAANKIAEFYRLGIYVEKDLAKAFEFYKISSESPKYTLCNWSKYNLAKYFYKNGSLEIGVKSDLKKCIELLNDICDELLEASIELIYIYYGLYLTDKSNNEYLDKIKKYKGCCENNPKYNNELKKEIENKLQKIYSNVEPLEIMY